MKRESKMPFSMYVESGEGCLIGAHKQCDSMEIIQVLEGKVMISVGTERFEAEAGDFVFIPADLTHRVDSEGFANLRGLVFESSILEENMAHFDTEILYMFHVQSRNRIAPLGKTHPIYPILKQYMAESYEEFVAKDVCYKLPIRANIYLMMTAYLRHYCGSKDESERMVYHNVLRLRPVIEYVEEHYKEKIYIDDLAEKLMVSPDYFTRMFKESIGKTPIDYINGLRVNRALELLENPRLSVAAVAEEIGFCNPNYFHKIFKPYMDVSPVAYRKTLASEA